MEFHLVHANGALHPVSDKTDRWIEEEALAQSFGYPLVETSAKTRINVDEVFECLVRRIQGTDVPGETSELIPRRVRWCPGCVVL